MYLFKGGFQSTNYWKIGLGPIFGWIAIGSKVVKAWSYFAWKCFCRCQSLLFRIVIFIDYSPFLDSRNLSVVDWLELEKVISHIFFIIIIYFYSSWFSFYKHDNVWQYSLPSFDNHLELWSHKLSHLLPAHRNINSFWLDWSASMMMDANSWTSHIFPGSIPAV